MFTRELSKIYLKRMREFAERKGLMPQTSDQRKGAYERKLYVIKESRPENFSATQIEKMAKHFSWADIAEAIAKDSQFKSERWYSDDK